VKEKSFLQLMVFVAGQGDRKLRPSNSFSKQRVGCSQLKIANSRSRLYRAFQFFGRVNKSTGRISAQDALEILNEPVLPVNFRAKESTFNANVYNFLFCSICYAWDQTILPKVSWTGRD